MTVKLAKKTSRRRTKKPSPAAPLRDMADLARETREKIEDLQESAKELMSESAALVDKTLEAGAFFQKSLVFLGKLHARAVEKNAEKKAR